MCSALNKQLETGGVKLETRTNSRQYPYIIISMMVTMMNASRAAASSGARPLGKAAVRSMSSIPSWASVDPNAMGTVAQPHTVLNLVGGEWKSSKQTMSIPHPLDKNSPDIFTIPDTQVDELPQFIESLRRVPKTGLHNPLKNPERYLTYGEISRKVGSTCNTSDRVEACT
jgi:1-pyrroline-5-carboxylate dehydrogenase